MYNARQIKWVWLASRTPMPRHSDLNCCSVVLAAKFSIDTVLVLGSTGCSTAMSCCCGGITLVVTTDRLLPYKLKATPVLTNSENKFVPFLSKLMCCHAGWVLQLMWWCQKWNSKHCDALPTEIRKSLWVTALYDNWSGNKLIWNIIIS
jgi:hypothetical protein